jgi:hypothetical protein
MAISLKWLHDNDLGRRGEDSVKPGYQPLDVIALDMPLMVFAAGQSIKLAHRQFEFLAIPRSINSYDPYGSSNLVVEFHKFAATTPIALEYSARKRY